MTACLPSVWLRQDPNYDYFSILYHYTIHRNFEQKYRKLFLQSYLIRIMKIFCKLSYNKYSILLFIAFRITKINLNRSNYNSNTSQKKYRDNGYEFNFEFHSIRYDKSSFSWTHNSKPSVK